MIDVPADGVLVRPAGEEHADRYACLERCVTVIVPQNGVRARGPAVLRHEGASQLALEIDRETAATDAASELVLEALLGELMSCVSGTDAREDGACRWLHAVRAYVEECALESFTLSDLARIAERDAAYVATCFKRAYGVTIGERVRTLRLGRARQLLARTPLPIAEIADRCGYADQSHFTRHFRRAFALTPAQYRQRQRRFVVAKAAFG